MPAAAFLLAPPVAPVGAEWARVVVVPFVAHGGCFGFARFRRRRLFRCSSSTSTSFVPSAVSTAIATASKIRPRGVLVSGSSVVRMLLLCLHDRKTPREIDTVSILSVPRSAFGGNGRSEAQFPSRSPSPLARSWSDWARDYVSPKPRCNRFGQQSPRSVQWGTAARALVPALAWFDLPGPEPDRVPSYCPVRRTRSR